MGKVNQMTIWSCNIASLWSYNILKRLFWSYSIIIEIDNPIYFTNFKKIIINILCETTWNMTLYDTSKSLDYYIFWFISYDFVLASNTSLVGYKSVQ